MRGEGAEYPALTQASVISLNALPETLINPNFCLMSQDTPDEKHAILFRTYSLNMAPRQRPIFLDLSVRISSESQGVSAATSKRVSIHPLYGDTFDGRVFEGSRSQLESQANVIQGYTIASSLVERIRRDDSCLCSPVGTKM